MNAALALLQADYIGVRDFKDSLSRILKKHKPIIITDNGTPQNVILPYEDMMEVLDILDELNDHETLKIIAEGRKAIRKGGKGRLVSKLFQKIEAKKK